MKKFLVLLAFAGLLVFTAVPSFALWEESLYQAGEGGIIGPVEREEGDIHNYNASAVEATDIEFVEAGVLGPVDRSSSEEVLLADCDQPFQNFMGEAGILEPVDRDSC